jgi:hypothetical protein
MTRLIRVMTSRFQKLAALIVPVRGRLTSITAILTWCSTRSPFDSTTLETLSRKEQSHVSNGNHKEAPPCSEEAN